MYAARTGTGAQLFRLLIGGLIGVSAAAQFALVPVVPVYARRLGLSGFEQGLVLGATGLPAGTLSDRFGPRRITLAAGLLMAVASAAQALAGNFPALFASRLVFGAGYGMVWTAGLVWLAGAAAGARNVSSLALPFQPSKFASSRNSWLTATRSAGRLRSRFIVTRWAVPARK